MIRADRFFRIALWLTAVCPAASFGQSTAGISGVVSDPQGASISGAPVSVVDTATGVRTQAVSNAAGFYALQNLPIGTYRFTVEHPGFRNYVHEDIKLTTGEELGLNVHLELGASSQAITISGEPPLLETRTSDISQLVESKSIDALPLGNRRTLNVLELGGATIFVSYANTPGSAIPVFSLAGGRTEAQMAWIDGGNGQNIRMGNLQISLDPPIETIAEVRVLSNNYAAEYGGSSSGVVVETTKSGTNQFHGSAYEFLRNNDMDAPGFFAPVVNGAKQSPELRYNVFGGSVGGPVRKNRTFFFFNYEGQRLRNGTSTTLTVPTALQDAGNFSQTLSATGKLVPIYDPNTTQLVNGAYTRQPFANNVIPASELDPVGLNVTKYYPAPNRAPINLAGASNFSANGVTASPADYYMIKGDHSFSDRDKLSGYYMRDAGVTSLTSFYPNNDAGDPTTHSASWIMYDYIAWTHIVNPTQLNEMRFTFNDRTGHVESAGLGGNYPTKLGLQGVSNDAFPVFAAAGFSTLGAANQERRQYPIQQEQFSDTYSYIHGRHSLKFGFEVRRGFNQDVLLNTVSGSFSFAATPTGLPGNTATGNGLASLLVGFPTAFSELQTEPLLRHSYYLGGFAQDAWTVTPNLTLNLGLRWETDTPLIDANNRMNGFDASQINPVSGTPGVVTFMGLNGVSSSPYHYQGKNFGPRFGFAWKPFSSDKIVVRGGFGIFFGAAFDSGGVDDNDLGFSQSASLSTPNNGITAPFYLRQGVPVQATAPALSSSFGAVPVGAATNTAVTFFDPNRGTGYAQQFNLGIQRQLSGGMLAEITVLGNLGRRLPNGDLSENQILPQLLGPKCDTQTCRPFPQFTNVSNATPTLGVSNYYAAVGRIEKRFAQGLSFGANYTWSKFLGNVDNLGGTAGNLGTGDGGYSNYYNRGADYGPNSNDIEHRAAFHWIYELPFGTGKRWLSKNPVRYVVGGWSVSNVATLQQSEPPDSVATQTNSCNCFSAGSQRPNVTGDVTLPSGERSVNGMVQHQRLRGARDVHLRGRGRGNRARPGTGEFRFLGAAQFPHHRARAHGLSRRVL